MILESRESLVVKAARVLHKQRHHQDNKRRLGRRQKRPEALPGLGAVAKETTGRRSCSDGREIVILSSSEAYDS